MILKPLSYLFRRIPFEQAPVGETDRSPKQPCEELRGLNSSLTEDVVFANRHLDNKSQSVLANALGL